MSHEYQFHNLAQVPSVGMIETLISDQIATTFIECSYHADERWIKVWFEAELTEDEETNLEQIVNNSEGIKRFRHDFGSVFFELHSDSKKRWQKHRRRINFNVPFFLEPTITVSGAEFDGAADLEIVNTTKAYFDFMITATRSRHKTKGFNSIEFNWEARSWE